MGVGPQNQTWVCIREIPLGSACNLTTMCFYYWKDYYPVERTTGLGCPSSYDSGQAIYYSVLISSPIKETTHLRGSCKTCSKAPEIEFIRLSIFVTTTGQS